MKGFYQANTISDIAHPVDDQWRGIPVGGVALIGIDVEILLIQPGPAPHDFKICHVLNIDTIKCCIFGAARITTIGLPFTVTRALAGTLKRVLRLVRDLLGCLQLIGCHPGRGLALRLTAGQKQGVCAEQDEQFQAERLGHDWHSVFIFFLHSTQKVGDVKKLLC